MRKINVLSEELCCRIAAGEVIDRPYSVVKELVENSLDAGANEIEIHIYRGGKDSIKVIDNGCGIGKEDMRAAFLPHATSKIKSVDDLDHINTLGFRGEALATICSVAQVELLSAVPGEEGNKVCCDGEFIGKTEPAPAQKGTEITVNNLFFNTPARFKFMRTDKKEESDITNFVTRFILGNPEVSFKYYIDGKLSLQSYGGGLEEAVAQVYGANVLPNCFKINADRNDIKISGFIGNQNFFKPNKTYQSLFLNGRYIVNNTIATAINSAYAPYAMKRQYPFYVLNMSVPDDIVDVNVHPNKADVRFIDNALIYGTVYKVVSSILDGTTKAADFLVENSVVPEIKSTFSENKAKNSVYAAEFKQTEKIYDKDFSDVAGIEKFSKAPKKQDTPKNEAKQIDYSVYENYEEPKAFNAEKDLPLNEYYGLREGENVSKKMMLGVSEEESLRLREMREIEEWQKKVEEGKLYRTFKYRGTLFNTYLLYEKEDAVYMIDQHAAHERILYDKLCEKLQNRSLDSQVLISPYIFRVNNEEKEFIEKNLSALVKMGFGISPFGPLSYRVVEVPVDLPDLNVKAFFDEFLTKINEMKSVAFEDLMRDKIAQTACKHAIKGGDELTEQERESVLKMVCGNLGLKCPHGRPVCVKMTKSAVEKLFKRKV